MSEQIMKLICPKCKSDRVIGYTHEGLFSLNCRTCKFIQTFDDRQLDLGEWYVEELQP